MNHPFLFLGTKQKSKQFSKHPLSILYVIIHHSSTFTPLWFDVIKRLTPFPKPLLRNKWTALNIFLVSLSNISLVCPIYIFLMCPIIECLQVSLCNLSIINQLLTNKSVNQIHDTLSIVNMPGRYMLLSECSVNPYRGEINWFILGYFYKI